MLSKTFFVLLLCSVATKGQSADCATEGSGKKCIFPFIFEGNTYFGCPPDLKEPKTWCSTKVDVKGNHVTGQGEFGFCNSACPKHECKTVSGPKPDAPCIFPFKYKGNTYNFCPIDPEDPTKRWCSTKVDASGQHVAGSGEYGTCGSDCPVEEKDTVAVLLPKCPGNDVCRPFVQCSALLSPQEALSKLCTLEGGSKGVCCKEVTRLEGTNSIIVVEDLGLRSISNLGVLSNSLVLRALDVGNSFLQNVTNSRSKATTNSNSASAVFQHAAFQQPMPGVNERGKACMMAMDVGRSLAKEAGVDPRSVFLADFSNADLKNSIIKTECPPTPKCNSNNKYRTVDGSCNNLVKPRYGQASTPLQRILPNAYADGFLLPRAGKNGAPLPSARLVSTVATGARNVTDEEFTAMLVAFGQFLDHDFDHVPVSRNDNNEVIDCCNEDGSLQNVPTDANLCFPIDIPENDPFLRGTRRCISFVRSVCSLNLDCTPGPIEQVNQITHWLDSSNVYGSTEAVARAIRLNRDGLMRTEPCDNGSECLPFAENSNCLGESRKCALAGDLRVNEQPTLGAMHLLWVREHNRIAKKLKEINAHWNDERLYQESRRIVNAEWQHIVYNEFLPVVLGTKFLENFNLIPLTRGFSNVYRNDFDPSVTNEFAAAAFRIGHTWISSVIKAFKGIRMTGLFRLQDSFNDADILRKGNNFDEILAGLTNQPSETTDPNFVEDITNNLFDDNERGMDLIALNMQRGRDHGLPGYVEYRTACRSGPSETFEDFSNNMTPESIEKLRKAYGNVENIDLFMGMTHETRCNGGRDGQLVGCTFVCLIGDVFARARLGDRFFYDLPNQPGSFTEAQLDQIRRVSLSRVICDNTNINEVVPLAFRRLNLQTNPLTQCNSRLLLTGIPTVDLTAFRERN